MAMGPMERVAPEDIVVNVQGVGRIIIPKGSTYTIGEEGGAYFGHVLASPAIGKPVTTVVEYPTDDMDVPEVGP